MMQGKSFFSAWLGLFFLSLNFVHGEEIFHDDFKGGLKPGWVWRREAPAAWRTTGLGLEIRALPGNMWGPANDATNLLWRALPQPLPETLSLSVTVSNQPTGQYEQADLVWYYDDSNMVKLGQELVDGKLSIVMGREEGDRTRTIAILPLEAHEVRLRLTVTGDQIRGDFLPAGESGWIKAGECDLPQKGDPKACLQVYQGLKDQEHWVRIRDFRLSQ